MMTANTELGYWMKDDSWYYYDEKKDIFGMTDEAPERAKRSFEMAMERGRKWQEGCSNSGD